MQQLDLAPASFQRWEGRDLDRIPEFGQSSNWWTSGRFEPTQDAEIRALPQGEMFQRRT